MPQARPPKIHIVGNRDTATVTVNQREWEGYIVYIPEKRDTAPTIGTHLVEEYGVKPTFEMYLIPTKETHQTVVPKKQFKNPLRRKKAENA